MMIEELNNKQDLTSDDKLGKLYFQFGELLNELRKRELSEKIEGLINDCVCQINSSTLNGKQLAKFIRKKQTSIITQIEKEYKIVPKNYYRNLWMIPGMVSFGVPVGLAFGLSVGKIGLFVIGLPIGQAIGLAFGTALDKKALAEGRQLNTEIKI